MPSAETSSADHVPENRAVLARQLRQVRTARQMSSRELGRRAGVSSGLVSLIENGRSGVSLPTLRKIAAVLDVPVVQFLVDGPFPAAPPEHRSVQIVRADSRPRLKLPHSPVTVELLTPDVSGSVEFIWVELEPGTRPAELMAHSGEEYALVISGVMHLWIGDEVHEMHAGDSVVFDPSIPHGVENPGSEKLIQVSAITPPSY
jgi:transcriptional regulator with XRE-family HTH domain